MEVTIENEHVIRLIIENSIKIFAETFSDRHLSQVDNENGTINMKVHNFFIAALGPEIQYYSAISRSFDSSLGKMLEQMAISIAKLNYKVSQTVEGVLYKEQINFIAELLEQYKRHIKVPSISDYKGKISKLKDYKITKRHENDYFLTDKETGRKYLIELTIGGDLDNKKARSEKESILEQYCILTNQLNSEDNVDIFFATAYNKFGEGSRWNQGRVLQFFSEDELKISKDFWNLICKSDKGFDFVMNEYNKNAHYIVNALERIKKEYLS